jgi:hypothetical protein
MNSQHLHLPSRSVLAGVLAFVLSMTLLACNRDSKNQEAAHDASDSTEASEESKPLFSEDKPLPGKPPTARNRERLALILSRRSIDDVGQVREEGLLAATLLSDGTGFREIADLSKDNYLRDVTLMRGLQHVLYVSEMRTSATTGQQETMLIQRNLLTGEEKEWIYGETFGSNSEHLRHMPTGIELHRLLFQNSKTYVRSEGSRAEVMRFEYHPFTHSVLAINYQQAVFIDFATGKRKTHLYPDSRCTRIGLNKTLSIALHVVDSTTANIFNFVQTIGDNRFQVLDTAIGKITKTVGGVNADFSRFIIARRLGAYPIKKGMKFPNADQIALSDSNFKTLKILPGNNMELSGDGNDLYFWANGIEINRKGGGGIWRVALDELPYDASKLALHELAPLAEKIFDLGEYNVLKLQIHPLEL